MEPNKILSANILDLVFDNRNKDYGAYELRVTYPERVKRALIIAFAIAAVAITGAALSNSIKPKQKDKITVTPFLIPEIKPDDKEQLPPPEPKKTAPLQTKTETLTALIKMVKDRVNPLVTQDDFKPADVGSVKSDGPDDADLVKPNEIDKGAGIIEVDAKFEGNWGNFLIKYLNENIPVDNGAPAGVYKVIIQFVVDVEGNVSDIKAVTNHGYGMEQEAIRVLKKATRWIPANQNGRPVKAYRQQPITFKVMAE